MELKFLTGSKQCFYHSSYLEVGSFQKFFARARLIENHEFYFALYIFKRKLTELFKEEREAKKVEKAFGLF